jgi:hypothetical protein
MAALFSPILTASLAVTTSTGRVALAADASTVRLYNAGTATAFVKFGDVTVTAATTNMPIPAGAIEAFRPPGASTHIAAITSSGTATLYVTSGEGQ